MDKAASLSESVVSLLQNHLSQFFSTTALFLQDFQLKFFPECLGLFLCIKQSHKVLIDQAGHVHQGPLHIQKSSVHPQHQHSVHVLLC